MFNESNNDVQVQQEAHIHTFSFLHQTGYYIVALVSKIPPVIKLNQDGQMYCDDLDIAKLNLELATCLEREHNEENKFINFLINQVVRGTSYLQYVNSYPYLDTLLAQPAITWLCTSDCVNSHLWRYIKENY